MQIGKAARRAGLTVKTVRYYANIGLVTPQQDAETGYRLYDAANVAKLQFVGKARRFDFSVEECRELQGENLTSAQRVQDLGGDGPERPLLTR